MSSLANHCRTKIDALEKAHRRRVLPSCRATSCLIDFASNDYLGLSNHPEVIAAGQAALAEYGAGAGASRLVTGNHPLYTPLEAKLADMKHKDAALVFGSGYLTNLGVIPALVGKGDLILADKLAHACLLDGAQLSGVALKRFKHNDMSHLEVLLMERRAAYAHVLILVDHVYSMDGDVAPMAQLARLARKYDAWLLADDAHGFGIVTPAAQPDIWMGTLSKSVGAYGGYVAAEEAVIEHLTSAARSFMFSTGLPPSVCASALKALEIMQNEPERGARAISHARQIVPDAQSAIVPILLGDEAKTLKAAEILQLQGILAIAIRPPTVPPGTSRLRLSFSSDHTDADVDTLRKALADHGLLA